MSHIAEPWFLLKGEPLLGGSVGSCVGQRASKRVALEGTYPGGQESGLHLLPSDSVPGCLGFWPCWVMLPFLPQGMVSWAYGSPRVTGPSPSPQASSISPLAARSDLERTLGTGTAWLLAGLPAGLRVPCGGSKCPVINVGTGTCSDPRNCRLVVDRGCYGTMFPQWRTGCVLMRCNF